MWFGVGTEAFVFGAVFFVEFGVVAGELDGAALDEGGFDLGGDFEDIAIGDEEGRIFTDLEGADTIGDTEDFGGSEGDGAEGILRGESVGGGGGGVVGEVANEGCTELGSAGDAVLDAGFGEACREGVRFIVGFEGAWESVDTGDDDGDGFGHE